MNQNIGSSTGLEWTTQVRVRSLLCFWSLASKYLYARVQQPSVSHSHTPPQTHAANRKRERRGRRKLTHVPVEPLDSGRAVESAALPMRELHEPRPHDLIRSHSWVNANTSSCMSMLPHAAKPGAFAQRNSMQ